MSTGLAAVRVKYGSDVARRIELWPDIALAHAIAKHGDDRGQEFSMVEKEVKEAKVVLQRCKHDQDRALGNARAMLQRRTLIEEMEGVPFGEIPVVEHLREWYWGA